MDLKSYSGGEAYDTVLFWDLQCYSYVVSDADKDFRVKLQSFSGDPNVYLNPTYPINISNFTDALYNSKDHFWNEELVLDPQTRKKHGG